MHDRALTDESTDNLRSGLHISALSIAWTVTTSAIAIVLGLRSNSLVLMTFGMTGVLDAVGSATLVSHFRHALRHRTFSERRERLALRVVALGLLVVGAATAADSALRLVDKTRSQSSIGGLVTAFVSMCALALLSKRKRRIARRIPSRALLADSSLSAVGCTLALVTVAGVALKETLGWWWLDPAAAFLVACGAIAIGATATFGVSKSAIASI